MNLSSVLAVVEYGDPDHRRQALLTAAGWQIRGHPESLMPAMLDRITRTVETSGADPAPHRKVAYCVAEFLGGEVRWLKPDQPPRPGWVN